MLPHAPQFSRSLARVTQVLPHTVCPAGHTVVHAPMTHTCPEGHALLQRPQWFLSVVVLVQNREVPASQVVRGAGQTSVQTPETHA
jgi:hypothetical protein